MFSFCVFLTVYICLHRQACEAALKEKQNHAASETEGFVDETALATSDQFKALNLVFKKATEDDTPSEVSIDLYFSIYAFVIVVFLIFPCPQFRISDPGLSVL